MKTFRLLFIVVAASLALVSCQKSERAQEDINDETGVVCLRFSTVDDFTKAASINNESTLTDVQVILFNSADELYKYYMMTASEITAKSCKFEGIKTGRYTMYVIANGPDLSKIQTKENLLQTKIMLGDYNDPSKDFVMSGHTEQFAVSTDKDKDVDVQLTRYVTRVTITEIKNNLPAAYGDMTINYAVLSNVVGKQIIEGTYGYDIVSTDFFYNRDCRADEDTRVASHIIGTTIDSGTETYKASYESDTFIKYSSSVANGSSYTTPAYFYGYPNKLTDRGAGFSDPFTQKATSLDLSISFKVNGTLRTYYYNVPLEGTSENPGIMQDYNYNVKIVISAEGQDEPGKNTDKGSINANISIKNDWDDGQSIEIDFI